MKPRFWVFVFCLMTTVVLCAVGRANPSKTQPKMTAQQILDRVDDMWRGKSSIALFAMKVKTRHWERTLTMKSYSLGKDYSLISIRKPKKERGTATLKVKQEMWNYLPKVDRVIKIPSSMLLSSWMGSHFTNDDLVKESRMTEDYDFAITFDGKREGRDIYEITLKPKPNAPVVWGKVVLEVDKKNYMPMVEYYYDEQGKLARTGTFGDIKVMDGKEICARMRIIPADKKGEYTEVITEKIKFDVGLKPDFFSLKRLQRR